MIGLGSSKRSKSRADSAAAAAPIEIIPASNYNIAFFPSDKFVGPRAGYRYKLGNLGVGYYLDCLQVRDIKTSQIVHPSTYVQHKTQKTHSLDHISLR